MNFEYLSQITNQENREERANVLLRFLHNTENIETLNGQKFEEIFSNEDQKRRFIEGLRHTE